MPTLPTTVQSSPTEFTPAFNYVAQTTDFDDIFAIAAMISGKTIQEIRELAIAKIRHPVHGPYFYGEVQIASLFAQLGYVATTYREGTRVSAVPDVALILIDNNPEMEVGRHILFHRAKASHAPEKIEYAIDPAPWIAPTERVRTGIKDKDLVGTWVIGITPMNGKAGASR